MRRKSRQPDSIRKQIRLISEAIDDDPQMLGHKMTPGRHPIDQLIQYTQQNMIKWSWNDNKFIRAMRDVYHNAGKNVPSSREELVKDLQKESEQDPKLLDKLIAALGGMSRRHFMGLSAGAGAGLATGMIDLKGHEKGAVDKTLRPGQHYKVTYRNFQNKTRVWRDLIFDSASSHMYWFQDPNKPFPKKKEPYSFATKEQEVKYWQKSVAEKQAILTGKLPIKRAVPAYRSWRGQVIPAKPAKFVKPDWVKTVAMLKRQIAWRQERIKSLLQPAEPTQRHVYHYVTLQIENVVDVLPLGSK